MSTAPTEAEVLAYFVSLSNAGRWGDDDVLGTLNHITATKRVGASRLVTSGRVVNLAWPFDNKLQPNEPMGPPHRFMLSTGEGARNQSTRQHFTTEYQGLAYHGSRITHIDALSHVAFDGELYNGNSVELVTSRGGATVLDVTAAQGIMTRGILLDVPRHRGIEVIPAGDLVQTEEILEILKKENLEIEAGDVLLLRTGNGSVMNESGRDHMGGLPGPGGFHVSCMPFIHASGVSMIGADMPHDRNASDYGAISHPVHAVGITALGLYLIDNCNLEDLARACVEEARSEFQFVVSAVPFIGATGSPVNPMAIF